MSITATSVDDIIHASNVKLESEKFVQEIQSRYQISDKGEAHWILGCHIM
jgi:hypothetical protein